MDNNNELIEALEYLDPSDYNNADWVKIGQALHYEGVPCEIWDAWSSRDIRGDGHGYKVGECEKRWRSFSKDGPNVVTGNTIFSMAYEKGYRPIGNAIGFDDYITIDGEEPKELKPKKATAQKPAIEVKSDVSVQALSDCPVPSNKPLDQSSEIISYLQAMFEPDEYVRYITDEVTQDDGKYRPTGKGMFRLTQAQIIENLRAQKDVDLAIGEAPKEGGAFVCINPLDGEGVSNKNVTAFRHALLESDTLSKEKQLAFYKASKLPVSAIVYSGGKSVHALVRVDAENEEEYKKRVGELYAYCIASGFDCDEQNKNTARLSRLPGIQRGENWQRLIPINWEHYKTWNEWRDGSPIDGVPDFLDVSELTELPEPSPELIEGLLRENHIGMIAGPSKSGKSFSLIELAIALARGWDWFGFKCNRAKTLLINPEIEDGSFTRRIGVTYEKMCKLRGEKFKLSDLGNLKTWNLRGKNMSLETLAPRLLKKAQDEGFKMVIIDSIYMFIQGDENSANEMSTSLGCLSTISNTLGVGIWFSHHYAKGLAGSKNAIDRFSGSGVFARFPDAIVDMAPIAVDDEHLDVLRCGDDDQYYGDAYRISFSLREFRSPRPIDVVFKWPIHEVTHELYECPLLGSSAAKSQKASKERTSSADDGWDKKNEAIGAALEGLKEEGVTPTKEAVKSWLLLHSVIWNASGWTNSSFDDCFMESRAKHPSYQRSLYIVEGKGKNALIKPRI